jgi:two-component system chemotaxis sensor kinase CheA
LASGASDYVSVLVLGLGERRIAVQVEEILAEEEVLLKGLGQQLLRVRNIAGATVLGTGQVVPILNVADLIVSATHPGVVADTGIRPEPDTAPPRHILVAEDSITSRSLIMNILESGGYVVTTAVDGMDAFAKLGKGGFDLVVSDVDMPRMSGFELTKKIRDDQLLGQLPVILVTALGSRQDQERGVEVGASAYIIKSSFDQSNLLDVVRRLL